MKDKLIPENDDVEDLSENASHSSINKYYKLKVLAVFVILCILISNYIFILLNKAEFPSNETRKVITSSSPHPTVTIQPTISLYIPSNPYETKDTKIASSLEVPPLYPDIAWEELSLGFLYDGINDAAVTTDDFRRVPFQKGKLWYGKTEKLSFEAESYYALYLSNKGWTDFGSDELKFNTFSLGAINAGGPCGNLSGNLGYKDGFVRLVAIQYQVKPCPGGDPLGPTIANIIIHYAIFISEPTKIEEIYPYISR